MHINFSSDDNGIIAETGKRVLILNYGRKVWENLPEKEKRFFIDNIAYSNTSTSALVAEEDKTRYNTSLPFIKKYLDESVLKDIPSAVEDYEESTSDAIEKFKKLKHFFKDKKIKKPIFSAETGKRAIVPFSCGKDSLLTLGVCNEIGLDPVAVYFNDTVSRKENNLKIKFLKKIGKEKGIKTEIIRNEFEKLNDFDFWDKDESVIGYSHLIFNFCTLAYPLNYFYNAKYLVLGNENGLDAKFRNKDGIWCHPSYDQSFKGTKRLQRIFDKFYCDKVKVTSVISSACDILMMKILHGRYKDLGKYQSSCSCLDASSEKRWCCECNDDVRFFIYMLALGKDPKSIGIKKNLLDKKYIKNHVIFHPESKERYDKVSGGDAELKIAYYLAYNRGVRGYAMDLFKKRFYDDVKSNENKLFKRYIKIYNSSLIPSEIKRDILSIYKEELAEMQL